MTEPPATPDDPLTRNLLALQEKQPGLVERIQWPVSGDHLFRDERGRWIYRRNDTAHELAQPAELLAERVEAALASGAPGDPVLVFGLGTGDLLEEVLRRAPEARIVAWDRDPWVLRQVLIARDFSEELRAGRLVLLLHADLVELLGILEQSAAWRIVEHPFLAGVYANERLARERGLGEKRAFVCEGSLFVESLADSLRVEGYSVLSFDIERLAARELALAVDQFRPRLVAAINYTHGLAEFCEAHELDCLCWEIDPATDEPTRQGVPTPRTRIFTYREANVPVFRRAGFEQVEYLALAADPRRRRPVELDAEERERYAAPISFVGTSLLQKVASFQNTFAEYHETWRPGSGGVAHHAFAELVGLQRENFAAYRVPEHLEELCPGFREWCLSRRLQDPVMLAAEVCAAEKRLNYVAELAEFGIQVWGDEGWKAVEEHGVSWRGSALHRTDLPRIYSASTINLDIDRIYQSDIVSMRIFDILACGGFVLAEHSTALEGLFEIGVEVESYRTFEELREKVAHYLAHEREAREIAHRGRAAVLARHTIDARVRYMLSRFDGNTEPAQVRPPGPCAPGSGPTA